MSDDRPQTWAQACYQYAAEHEGRKRHIEIAGRPIRAAVAKRRVADDGDTWYELDLWHYPDPPKADRRTEQFEFDAATGQALYHAEDVT